jgi:hypothetical protein
LPLHICDIKLSKCVCLRRAVLILISSYAKKMKPEPKPTKKHGKKFSGPSIRYCSTVPRL